MKFLARLFLICIIATILFLSPIGNPSSVKPASAYVLEVCKWSSTDRVDLDYRNVNLTSTMWEPTTRSLAIWNDVSDKISLVPESPSGDHQIDFVKHTLDSGTPARTLIAYSGSTCSSMTIQVDEAQTNPTAYKQRMQTISHEIGHALGLNHSDINHSVMAITSPSPWEQFGIFTPVWDDFRGLSALYGTPGTTSLPSSTVNGGTVTYGPWPINLRIDTPGSGKYAMAYVDTSLPSSNAALIAFNVTGNTMRRFGSGLYTSANPNANNRFGTAEVDNDGIKIMLTVNCGGTPCGQGNVISGSASSGVRYFMIIVATNIGGTREISVFAFDTRYTTDSQWVGTHTRTQDWYAWSQSPLNHGAGVWTDSSSDPASNYDLNTFESRMRN